MAYGIGSILGDIDQKADAYRNNPDALAQAYQQNQQLIDLLVLQKLKTDKEAAQRDMQAKMQTPASTIKDQREQQVMGMTRNEVTQQVTPGLQALGQQMQAAQAQPQAQGISSVPAPNMQQIGMKGGGIIAFQEGGTPASRADAARRAANLAYHKGVDDKTALTTKINELYGDKGRIWGGIYENQTDAERKNARNIMNQLQMGASIEEMQSLLTPKIEDGNKQPQPAATPYISPAPAEDGMGTTTVTPTGVVPAKKVITGLPEDERAQIAKAVNTSFPKSTGILSALPKKEDVLKVPANDVAQAPPPVKESYAQQLADLRVEQESKLESLIAFLKGAGGQSSFAATMMGGSDAMNAREAEVKGEIMDVLGKLEAIDMKEQEFGIATERNDIAREANRLQSEASANQNASQERMNAAEIASQEYRAGLTNTINDKGLDIEDRLAAVREVESNTAALLAKTAATRYIDDNVRDSFKVSLVGLTAARTMLTELIAANVGSEATLKQYEAQSNEYAKTIDEINRRLTGLGITSVPAPSGGTPDTDAADAILNN